MKKLNPKIFQLASEGLIPLLGLFIWNWSLYFILLFYFFDLIANEAIMNLKSKKTVHFQGLKMAESIKYSSISLFTLLISIIVIHFAMVFIHPGIDFLIEFSSFWNYEEFGIKQGYFLVPLIVFVSFQQYKMEFLHRAIYRKAVLKEIWNKHTQALIVIVAFAGLCLGISQFFVLPEALCVLGIIALSSLYKWRFN
ncbi:hypothetical protein N9528_02520 [Crocinitomicaceae bacterium]|nr:hypothetical protein [Crocinitomicaceae bacterium]